MDNNITTTKHKIGKTTYLVAASPSEKATDTIDKKIEKLILKDMRESPVTTAFDGDFSAKK